MSAAVTTREVDVSGVVDLDLLQGELDAARGQVEMWCAQRELSMKQQVAAHKTNMMDSTTVWFLSTQSRLTVTAWVI